MYAGRVSFNFHRSLLEQTGSAEISTNNNRNSQYLHRQLNIPWNEFHSLETTATLLLLVVTNSFEIF